MATATRPRALTLARFGPLLAVLVALGLGASGLRSFEIDWEAVAALGYPGLFVTCVASSATVAVPVPGIVAVFFAGKFLDPVLVGLVSGLGSAIGELSGYLLGCGGRAALGKTATEGGLAGRLEQLVRRFGFAAILIFAFIPNPVFDMAGVAAGAARMSAKSFFLAVSLGKTARMILVALAGHYALDWVIG